MVKTDTKAAITSALWKPKVCSSKKKKKNIIEKFIYFACFYGTYYWWVVFLQERWPLEQQ
jgi:hypothetical protein